MVKKKSEFTDKSYFVAGKVVYVARNILVKVQIKQNSRGLE